MLFHIWSNTFVAFFFGFTAAFLTNTRFSAWEGTWACAAAVAVAVAIVEEYASGT